MQTHPSSRAAAGATTSAPAPEHRPHFSAENVRLTLRLRPCLFEYEQHALEGLAALVNLGHERVGAHDFRILEPKVYFPSAGEDFLT